MKKLLALLACIMVVATAAFADGPFRNHRYDTFKVLPINSEQIVFIGNSITNMHEWWEAFGNHNVVNRGVSGAVTDEALANIEAIAAGLPKKVFIMLGTNDLGTSGINTTKHVIENITLIVDRLQKTSPDTDIYIQSILPSTSGIRTLEALQAANEALSEMCTKKGITYIDLWDSMTGITTNTISYDRLHLTAGGYKIWCDQIAKYVNDDKNATSVYDDSKEENGGLGGANGMRATVFSKLPVNSDDILMIGDEMINGGEWHELLQSNKVKNRGTSWGYPGPSLTDMLKMIPCILHDGATPAQVFLYTGVADVNGSTNLETVLTNYKAVVEKITELSPTTKITLMSLQPTATASTNTGRVAPFNELLEAYAAENKSDNIEYLDIYTDFINGTVANTDYFTGHYLYGKGYIQVAQKIAAAINNKNIVAITTDDANSVYTRFTNRTALGTAIVTAALLPEGNGVGEYTTTNLAAVKTAIANAYTALATTTSADATFDTSTLTTATNNLLPQINMPATSTTGNDKWYQLYTPNRDSRYLTSNGTGAGVTGDAANSYARSMWKFVTRNDGDLDIINRKDGSYLAPTAANDTQITTSKTQPTAGWALSYSNSAGLFIVVSKSVQLNQTQSSLGYKVYNWGGGSNRGDNGCQYKIALYEGDPEIEPEVPTDANFSNVVKSTNDLTEGWYKMRVVTGTDATMTSYITAGTHNILNADEPYRQNASNFYPLKIGAYNTDKPATGWIKIKKIGSNFLVQAICGLGIKEPCTATRDITQGYTTITMDSYGFSTVDKWNYYNPGANTEQPYVGKSSGSNNKFAFAPVSDSELVAYDIYTVRISDVENANEIGSDPSVTYTGEAAIGGISKVFNNGFFFFPAGTIPAASDFTVPTGLVMTVDSSSKTLIAAATEATPVTYTQVTTLDALTTGWYQIKATTVNPTNATLTSYIEAGTNYITSAASEYRQNASNHYPLQYGSNSNVETTFIRLTKSGSNYYLQSLNGHYVNANATASRTVPSSLTAITEGDTSGNGEFRLGGWAPFTQYYLGLYSSHKHEYTFYSISNLDANYDIYTLTIEGASNATEIAGDVKITCNNTANAALASVYNNGYFIFPAGTKIAASDFTGDAVEGKGLEVVINSDAKTITATYFDGYYKALGLAIDAATETLENTLEGISPGYYLTADRETLQAAIDVANVLNNTKGLTNKEVENAITILETAVEAYLAKQNEVVYSTTGNETWYYITSASTKAYCTRKAIVSVSGEDDVAMKFDTKRLDPNMVWCLEKNNAGKVAIRNYATGRYFAANPATGTSATAQYVYTVAKWEGESLNKLGYTIKADGYNPVHAQDNGSLIVNWAAENNGASLWAFETLTKEELASPAELSNVTIGHGITVTGIGNTKQPLLRAQFVVEGLNGSATFDGLSGNTGNTNGAVSKLYIYSVTDVYEYRPDKEGAVLVGETTPEKDGSFTFTFNEGQTLPSGSSLYYWLVADISKTATEGEVIDASITSYTINGSTITEDNGNPDTYTTVFLTASTVEYLNTHGSRYYRIPAITKAMNGWLVAVTDKRWSSNGDLPNNIDVVARVSKDNGKTWTEPVTIAGTAELGGDYGHGDPAIVTDRETGDIFVLVTSKKGFYYGTPDDPARLKCIVSHDNGITWDTPVDITDQIYGAGCSDKTRQGWHSMFFSSGAALQTSKGTLMVVAPVRTTSNNTHSLFQAQIIRSDDHGKTWTCNGVPALYDADESKILELNDGRLLVKSRKQGGGYVYYSISDDDGASWSERSQFTDVYDPGCDGDIIRLTSTSKDEGANRLLLSIPDATSRKNVTVYLSTDEAKTWPLKKTICPGGSAYSSMVVLDDGTIGIYFEEDGLEGGYHMRYARFSLNWLTNGTDEIDADKFNAARVKEAQTLAANLPEYAQSLVRTEGELTIGNTYTSYEYNVTKEETAALKAAETSTNLQTIEEALTNYMDGYAVTSVLVLPQDGKVYRLESLITNSSEAYSTHYLANVNGAISFPTTADNTTTLWVCQQSTDDNSRTFVSAVGNGYLGWKEFNGTAAQTYNIEKGVANGALTLHNSSNSSGYLAVTNEAWNNKGAALFNQSSAITQNTNWSTDFVFEEVSESEYTGFATNVYEGSNGNYGTLNLPFATYLPEGVTAQGVTYDTADETNELQNYNLTLENGILPANTPVLLTSQAADSYTFAPAPALGTSTIETGFKGTIGAKAVEDNSYIMAYTDGAGSVIRFFRIAPNNNVVNANKAYFVLTSSSNVASLGLMWNGTTSIEGIEGENADNITDAIYDLTGRKINKITAPGIYIINGKKQLVK